MPAAAAGAGSTSPREGPCFPRPVSPLCSRPLFPTLGSGRLQQKRLENRPCGTRQVESGLQGHENKMTSDRSDAVRGLSEVIPYYDGSIPANRRINFATSAPIRSSIRFPVLFRSSLIALSSAGVLDSAVDTMRPMSAAG